MACPTDLTDPFTHFAFGKNWCNFAELIDEQRLTEARKSIERFVPTIARKTFLDIGSGSGLFSAAAVQLGAARVHAVDVDEHSVETTRRTLETFASGGAWKVEQKSVFELSAAHLGCFDIVYSWGVLHHTGDLWRAIAQAAAMVAPAGKFAFSIYEKTPACGIWRMEKRAYAGAGHRTQQIIRAAYKVLYRGARLASGRGLKTGARPRGMNSDHDIHDWLGGYPYESATGDEVRRYMAGLAFQPIIERPAHVRLGGLFGSGCSEYLYERTNVL